MCWSLVDVGDGLPPKSAEFRFESPISISKLNNYSDFGRKSVSYYLQSLQGLSE